MKATVCVLLLSTLTVNAVESTNQAAISFADIHPPTVGEAQKLNGKRVFGEVEVRIVRPAETTKGPYELVVRPISYSQVGVVFLPCTEAKALRIRVGSRKTIAGSVVQVNATPGDKMSGDPNRSYGPNVGLVLDPEWSSGK